MSIKVPLSPLHWKPSWRVIPTRYPEIDLWSRVGDPHDQAALNEIEQLTNHRLRAERGELLVLRKGDYFPKRCLVDVKASFCNKGQGGRFNSRQFGAYYAASDLKTAVCEKAHHTIRLLHEARITSMTAPMRVIKAEIKAELSDFRALQKKLPEVYASSDYSAGQQWATRLWNEGSQGVVYVSLRNIAGECIALFSPQTIKHCYKDRILHFDWDGKNKIEVTQYQEYLTFEEK